MNILLWSCWCATHFDAAPECVIRKAIDATADWNKNVTEKLREARRYMKTPSAQQIGAGVAELRAAVKNAELDAERVEQSLLQNLAAGALAAMSDDSKAGALARARCNLTAYAGLTGAAKKKDFSTSLLHELIDNIFADPNLGDTGTAPADKEQRDE